MALQIRRGTNAQRLGLTPVQGEIIYVTDSIAQNVPPIWVGDGTTVGGISVGAYYLNDLLDVLISSASEGQTLYYDQTTNLWKNSSILKVLDSGTIGIEVDGDISVLGGDVTTTATVGNLFNTNATTVNVGNDATTEVNLGSPISGRVQIKSPQLDVNGNASVGGDITINGGNINLNGAATAGVMPFLTFANQADGVNSLYGIRGKSTVDDPWFVGAGSTGDDGGYLEIATGDNANTSGQASPIYIRQYDGHLLGGQVPWYGGTAPIVNSLTLLDGNGNTIIPNNLTVDSGTLFVDAANNRVGINNTSPSSDLEIGTSSSAITQMKLTNADGSLTITNDSGLNLASVNLNTANRLQFSATDQWFNSGKLGINTATPGYELDIKSAEAGPNDNVQLAMTNSERSLIISNDASNNLLTLNYDSQNRLQFDTSNQWFNSGSLGVNTASPAYELDVNGTASATDFITNTYSQREANQTTVSSTSSFTLAGTARTAMKLIINIKNNVTGAVHICEALAVDVDGSTALLTVYAEMFSTASLANFSASVTLGNLLVTATPASSQSTTFTILQENIT